MDATQIIIELIKSAVLIYVAYITRKTNIASERTEQNTNHMKDELVALTQVSSLAKGKLEGKAEAKAEQSEAQIFPDQK